MIHKFVNELIRSRWIPDLTLEREDLLQTARMYAWEAITQYDEKRGAKLSTFIYLKLFTKFSNISRKIICHSKRPVIAASQLENIDHAIDGTKRDSESTGALPESLLQVLSASADSHEVRMDLKRFYSELNKGQKRLLIQYFIKGYSQQEMAERNPDLSLAGIKKGVREIRVLADQLGLA